MNNKEAALILVNTSKTKLMTNSTEMDIELEGNKLEYVNEYIYLGKVISPCNHMEKEYNKRVACSWKKYWSLKEIRKSKDYSISTKGKRSTHASSHV